MVFEFNCHHYYESSTTSPKGRIGKPGWLDTHEIQKRSVQSTKSNTILIGDSIIKKLSFYKNVWINHFGLNNNVNCGIGGDSVENVLWRVCDFTIPKSVDYVVLLCGTNNLTKNSPVEIVNGILAIGKNIVERQLDISVIISGILPRDSALSNKRNYIDYINYYLESFCSNNEHFFFMKLRQDWTLPTGELKNDLFIKDKLHLSEIGNEKLAKEIIASIKLTKYIPPEVKKNQQGYNTTQVRMAFKKGRIF